MQPEMEHSPQSQPRRYELSPAQREQLDRVEAEIRDILGAAASDDGFQTGTQARDQAAMDDERVFIRRFGFDWPRSDRIGVIALKRRLDLTDREIRLLKWTGNLKRSHGVVTLASARWAAIFGRCLGTFALCEFGLVMLLELAGAHHALSASQVVKLYGVMAFVLAMVWLVHLGYIKPWIIEQRVMKRAGPDARCRCRSAPSFVSPQHPLRLHDVCAALDPTGRCRLHHQHQREVRRSADTPLPRGGEHTV